MLEGQWQGQEVSGLGECIQGRVHIPAAEYAGLAERFTAEKFDAGRWVRLARQAGMRYVCVTAKHHDGFAMYDSAVSDFNIVKATPFGRDMVAELAAACRQEGMPLGLYYSQMHDWHEPNGVGNTWDFGPDEKKDIQRYLDEKAKPQMRELLTNYGPIGLMWFDVPTHSTYERSRSLAELVREVQPSCLMNNRIGHDMGDYESAPDNSLVAAGFSCPWEVPATMNNTWGFKRADEKWKPTDKLIGALVDVVSKGGNYLLNVGPRADGTVPEAAVRRLEEIGTWMARHGESIYGAGPSPLPGQFVHRFGRCTAGEGQLFLHVQRWPADGELFVPGLGGQVAKAYLLADPAKTSLPCRAVGELDVRIGLRAEDVAAGLADPMDTVVAVEFAGPVKVDPRVIVLPDEPVELHSFEAHPQGQSLRYANQVWDACVATEPTWAQGAEAWAAVPEAMQRESVTSVVNWSNAAEYVWWAVRVVTPGEYKVLVTYAAGDEAAGTRAAVVVGKGELEFPITPSGGWYKYKTVLVGTVEFTGTAGCTVAVRPVKISGRWLMNLKRVTIRPADWQRPNAK